MTKQEFLSVFSSVLKEAGVFIKTPEGKYSQNSTYYWGLLRLIENTVSAIISSAGQRVSLSGILTGKVCSVGKGSRKKYFRPKKYLSEKSVQIFRNNTDLTFDSPPSDSAELLNRVRYVLKALGDDGKIGQSFDDSTPVILVL